MNRHRHAFKTLRAVALVFAAPVSLATALTATTALTLLAPAAAAGQEATGGIRNGVPGDWSEDWRALWHQYWLQTTPTNPTSTTSSVPGALVDQLPIDDAADIVVLQPGVVETNIGRSFRGGRPNEEAVLIDGVLSRSFGRGDAAGIALPTTALERVEVTTGTYSAEYGEAQSGLVRFQTRSGGDELTGSFEVMSDQLGPEAWRTNFNRAELTLGGPIAGPLTFFLAGTAQGQDAFTTQLAPNRFAIDGADTCDIENFCETALGGPGLGAPATFRLPRTSSTPGLADSVVVTAPRFVEFANGRTAPHGWNQIGLLHANVRWQLPRSSRVTLSLNRNRQQGMGHAGFTTSYLPDGVDGALGTRSSYALSWFQVLKQNSEQQLALDLLAAYSRERNTGGMLDQAWWSDHRDPAFGFVFGNLDFAFDDGERTVTGFDAFDPPEAFIGAYRSNAVPRDSMVLLPGRTDLAATSQSLNGLSGNLRANPYSLSTGFPLNGAGNDGLTKSAEDRLQLRGAADWQIGRVHRIRAGAEYFAIGLDAFSQPLAVGVPLPESADPRKLALFAQDRLELGDLVLDAGLRYDRLDPDVEYPIVPGFVFNVPDSLRAGFVRYDGDTGAYVPLDPACNGAPTCRSNFVEAETKSELSPRLGASYALSSRSSFRVGFGRFVQTPAFFTTTSPVAGEAGVAPGNLGLLHNVNLDLQNGSTGVAFGRDVDLPSSRLFELGYRARLGDDLLLDVAAFDRKRSNALTVRRAQFEDPNTGSTTFLNVLANAEDADSRGFEIRLDHSLGSLVDGRLSYSFVDAEAAEAGALLFTEPIALDQSRRHAISWMGSLTFPADYREGSVVGAILRDVGLFAVLKARSGLSYTLLENQGSGQVGPPDLGGSGLPAGAFGEETTPWAVAFDLRLTKSFPIGDDLDLQAFVDWRNPFDIETSSLVFLETGAATNDLFRARTLDPFLRDTGLDGDNAVDDFDIRAESPENAFNTFMLLRVEQRFGDGDGIFTVEEQEAAFGQLYENEFGAKSRFETSDQLMRLGVRLAF